MRVWLKRIVVVILIVCMLVPSLGSGAVYALDGKLNVERAGNYVANFAINFYENWSSVSVEEGKAEEGSSGGSASVSGNYDFAWPLENALKNVSSEFGLRSLDNHKGMDFGVPMGTPVYSSSDGVVKIVDTGCIHNYNKESNCCGNGYGNHVVIETGDDVIVIYGHLTNASVKVGDTIKQGQQIGTSGCTGWSTGPHLHFEFVTVEDNVKGLSNEKYIVRDSYMVESKFLYSVNPRLYVDEGATIKKTSFDSNNKKTTSIIRGSVQTEYDENAKLSDIKEGKTPYKFSNTSWIEFVYKYALGKDVNYASEITKLGSGMTGSTHEVYFDNATQLFGKEIAYNAKSEGSDGKKTDAHIIDAASLISEGKILPGDVLYVNNGKGGGEYVLYVGGTKIIYATPPVKKENSSENKDKDKNTDKDVSEDTSGSASVNSSALKYEYYQYYLKKIRDDLYSGHENDKDYKIPAFGVTKVYRLNKKTASSISETSANLIFNGKGYYSFTQYDGTPTDIRMDKSSSIFSFLFSKIEQLLDFLINLIVYMVRMQVVGWANMVENLVQKVVLGLSGDNNTSGIVDAVFGTNATTVSGDRITIESILFNQIPIIDANFFNFETAGGHSLLVETNEVDKEGNKVKVPDNSSIVYILRKNLQSWYVVVRNLSIALMLFILIYLGIRLAISASSEKKAELKKLLMSWVTGMCIILFIHIFMYMVFVMNDALVGICKDIGGTITSQESGNTSDDKKNNEDIYEGIEVPEKNEELSLYDAIRTKAYAFDRREGIPATILYIYLIYIMLRFLLIYLKRYLTVYILALSGSFMGAKYALERIAGKKTNSFNKWLKDYSFNVLLQTVHAFIYVLFIGIAFSVSQESIGGAVIALFILNFMLKADKIVVRIFGLDKAGSLAEVNNPGSFRNMIHDFMPVYTIGKVSINLTKGLYGRTVKPFILASTGKSSLKDAQKVLEMKKYERIGRRARRIHGFANRIGGAVGFVGRKYTGTVVGRKTVQIAKHIKNSKLGGVAVKGLRKIPIKKIAQYNKHKRLLGKGLSMEANKQLYKQIKNTKKMKRQRFTRSVSAVRDVAFGTFGVFASIPAFIADPLAGTALYAKSKKTLDKHRTMSRAMRNMNRYTASKSVAKQVKKNAQNNYNMKLNIHTNKEYQYQTERNALKDQYRLATTQDEKDRIYNEIKAKDENRKMEQAKELHEIEDAYEKLYEAKVSFGNAKHEKGLINKTLTAVGTVTGAGILADIAQNEATKAYEISDKASKAESQLQDVNKVVNLEMELRTLTDNLKQLEENYKSKYVSENSSTGDSTEEERLKKQVDSEFDEENRKEIIEASRKANIKSSEINKAINEHLYNNKKDRITSDDIGAILAIIQANRKRVGKKTRFTDEVKAKVKEQIKQAMIDKHKGLGFDTKDAITEIRKALGENGVLTPEVSSQTGNGNLQTSADVHNEIVVQRQRILQKLQEINTYNEIAKIKYKGTLVDINKIIKDLKLNNRK